jgi:vancomycin aglycone glucosyltransferase
MRVVMSTYDSRGGIEPYAALAVRLRELGAEALIVAPPDCADRLAGLGVAHVPFGRSVRELVHGDLPPQNRAREVPRIAAELMESLFGALLPAAEGADVLLASGLVPVTASGRSVAERLGIPSVLVSLTPLFTPSPHRPPVALPGRPLPEGETDLKVLHRYAEESYNALFGAALNANRAAVGLPAVDNVRAYVWAHPQFLACDPVLAPWPDPDVDVVQTGAWILPDERPLPPEVDAFLDAGEPPVFVTFGSMRPPADFARVAVEAIRAQGRRILIGRGWAGLAPIDDGADCATVEEVNQQALFRRVAAVVHHGGAGTTTTAALAGAPQVVVPQVADQPYHASRVAALGIGVGHDGPTPTVESLAAALATALTPQVRERAATVSHEIRTDGTTVAAQFLFNL